MELEEEIFRVSLPIQIRFTDIDAIGHINNNIYFTYFDLAKLSYIDQMRAKTVGWTDGIVVLAHIEADFISPVFYKESIVVDTKVVEMGNKSGVFLQQVRNVHTNEIKCRCRSVFVAYDPNLQTSMPIPDFWRESISKFEGIPLIKEKAAK